MQRTKTLETKLIAGLTLIAFASAACTMQAPTPTASRQVTVETWRAGDQEPELWSSSQLPLDEITYARRVVIDGVASTIGLGTLPTDITFSVPLNTGETAMLRSSASRIELVSFTGPTEGPAGQPRGTVKAVELREDGFALFYADSRSTSADVLIKLPELAGMSASERDAVIGALAVHSILLSLEDVEQYVWIAMAILIASVTISWMWICYDVAKSCAERCEDHSGWESSCGGLTVSWNGDGMGFETGGLYSCRCY